MENKVVKILSYMKDENKFTFVDMRCGGDFSGLEIAPVCEGNALIGISGERFSLPCVTLSRGTKKELQLRSYDLVGQQEIDERLIIGDLFPNQEVIIITTGDNLVGFAPVFADKLDLAVWLRGLRSWKAKLPLKEQWSMARMVEDMYELAMFLYRNNPHKAVSFLDELEAY